MPSKKKKQQEKNPSEPLRYQRTKVCGECKGGCGTGKLCEPVRKPLRDYQGMRFTADGFDCALPVSIDSHSMCSFSCLYCFSNFLGGHGYGEVGQYRLGTLERILSGESQGRISNAIRKALKRDGKQQPCPVQLGALADPFDNIERNQGWALKLPALLKKYNQPCRISTKGKLFLLDEYLDAYSEPDLFWVAFSIISIDDDVLRSVDKFAPTATERLECMRRLHSRGVKTTLRIRPMIPGITDYTKKHPKALRELIEKGAEAGAESVSIEVLFVPGVMGIGEKAKFKELCDISGYDLVKIYKDITPKGGACIRPSRYWTEEVVHHALEVTHECGMHFTISDPVWKELNDFSCCCGIPPNDPIFGNWERESATEALLQSKWAFEKGKKKLVGIKDLVPPWAYDILKQDMCMITRAKGKASVKYEKWADKLIETWNDLRTNRGVLHYFQGVLLPAKRDKEGNILYKYNPVERENRKTIWRCE
jgi:DNA repair photolyase